MDWFRELYRDLRFLARHSRRLVKVLIRNRMGYKRIVKAVADELRVDDAKQATNHRSFFLEQESRELGRPAQYIGQAADERAFTRSQDDSFHKGNPG